MVLRPEGVVSTYGFLPIYFIFPRIGQSSWSRFGAFSWVLIGLYCLRRPANLNVSCDRAVNCECWVRLIVSKSFSGTQLLQLASPLQLNQVTVCSCRVLNRRVISVYVLLLAWNSKVSSCSPSWLYVFVAVSWSQAVYHEIASVMLLGLKGIVSTFGYLIFFSPSRELVNLHEQGLEDFVCAKRVLFSPRTTLIWMSSASGRLVVNAECTLMLSKEFRGIVSSVRDCSFDSFKEFRRFPQVGRASAAHRYEISRLFAVSPVRLWP